MYSLFTLGVTLWGIYGVMTQQWSIIIANAITVILASIILGIKVKSVLTRGAGSTAH
jgi:MtN3 and saliva related transmembrane protein